MQTKLLVQRKAYSENSHTSGGTFLERQAFRKLVSSAFLDNSVLCEASTLRVIGVCTVGNACNAVAGFEALDTGADFDDSAAEVTSDGRAGCC
jgi:hypothetical protein